MTTIPQAIPLAMLAKGESASVACCQSCECREQLRALGIEPEARIAVCRKGDPFIVRVDHPSGGSCRIGIRRNISSQVLVRPIRGERPL